MGWQSMSEFQPKHEQTKLDKQDLAELANERQKEIHEQLERKSAERETSKELAGARQETKAALKEKQPDRPAAPESQATEIKKAPTRRDKNAKFDAIMEDTQSHMSPAGRTFSKIIHNPAIEKVSDASAKTSARPNAILAGSMMAFALVLSVYLIARHYGYPLSGSETMVAFVFGWVLGLVFDYFRAMFTGGRSF